MQQTAIKGNRELRGLIIDDCVPVTAPPAGPVAEPSLPAAPVSNTACPAAAVVAPLVDVPAAAMTAAAVATAPFGSPQASAETHTASDNLPILRHQESAAQSAVESAALSGEHRGSADEKS